MSISYSDAPIVVGGGRGTADSIEKAILSDIPVFIAYQIKGYSTETFDYFANDYHYLEKGDANFL